MKPNSFFDKILSLTLNVQNLALKSQSRKTDSLRQKVIAKTISQTRVNITRWRSALRTAENIDRPRRYALMSIYRDILLDGHLTSQIELRKSFTKSSKFGIYINDVEDAKTTKLLAKAKYVDDLINHMLDCRTFGHSLCELSYANDQPQCSLIPRSHVVPEHGEFLADYSDDKSIAYRTSKEYGTWLLEFGDSDDLGLLNKIVPHVLFKRFAQTAWVELCEIYGIPPRVLRTDTTDPKRMAQSEKMLQDMGSAAWMIIDSDEHFEFAQGVSTNGDVYNNLISLCKDEISLTILGAVMGQDTKNGNRSKEEQSFELLKGLIQSDKDFVEQQFNEKVIPALINLGILFQGAEFRFAKEINTSKLWEQITTAMPYIEFDLEWINETFGVRAISYKADQPLATEPPSEARKKLSAADFFV